MRRIFIVGAALLALLSPVKAADTTVTLMTAASALSGAELLYCVQAAADRKCTGVQVAAYVYGLMSGDATTNGTGTFTLATVNGNVGSFGSATNCVTLTVNAKGLITAASQAACTGTMSSITPGGGLVSGITASCTQTAITTTGTLSEARCINAQTGATYTVLDTDRGKLVTLTNAAAIAVTVPQAGAASAFANGWKSTFMNIGGTVATFTPTTSTINSAAAYRLFPGQSVTISSDGTNYQIDPGTTGGIVISNQTGANYAIVAGDYGKLLYLSNASAQTPTLPNANTLGANWFVQACNDNTGAQTITPTTSTIGGAATFVLPAGAAGAPKCVAIVSDGTNYKVVPDFPLGGQGTSALATASISSATCATAVTTAATGIATTDAIRWGFNGDPTAVTGYVPLVAGMLTIIAYPTANNVNFKVCNNTSSSITPGGITLNWQWGR